MGDPAIKNDPAITPNIETVISLLSQWLDAHETCDGDYDWLALARTARGIAIATNGFPDADDLQKIRHIWADARLTPACFCGDEKSRNRIEDRLNAELVLHGVRANRGMHKRARDAAKRNAPQPINRPAGPGLGFDAAVKIWLADYARQARGR
jgi:hypothetical protein